MTCTSRTYVIEQKSEKLVVVLILANQGSSTQEQKKSDKVRNRLWPACKHCLMAPVLVYKFKMICSRGTKIINKNLRN